LMVNGLLYCPAIFPLLVGGVLVLAIILVQLENLGPKPSASIAWWSYVRLTLSKAFSQVLEKF
jgi:hypothetical protein